MMMDLFSDKDNKALALMQLAILGVCFLLAALSALLLDDESNFQVRPEEPMTSVKKS